MQGKKARNTSIDAGVISRSDGRKRKIVNGLERAARILETSLEAERGMEAQPA
jgi:hypothetical protein